MTDPIQIGGRLLVIFDGHCGLCNHSVRWFLRRDRRDRLRFAPSEMPVVAAMLARHRIDALSTAPNSMFAVRDPGGPAERLLARSDGVLTVLAELPQPWPAVSRKLPTPAPGSRPATTRVTEPSAL